MELRESIEVHAKVLDRRRTPRERASCGEPQD